MEKSFNISGMSCSHCVKAVERELSELNLDHYEVEIGLAKIIYSHDEDTDQVVHAIEEAGYQVTSIN